MRSIRFPNRLPIQLVAVVINRTMYILPSIMLQFICCAVMIKTAAMGRKRPPRRPLPRGDTGGARHLPAQPSPSSTSSPRRRRWSPPGKARAERAAAGSRLPRRQPFSRASWGLASAAACAAGGIVGRQGSGDCLRRRGQLLHGVRRRVGSGVR
jgi:hypothetical protein